MSKITKAVIPAAGLGVRMLPISKAVPKEMASVVDKPAIHYQVKEAVLSGIEDILIVTSKNKSAVKNYFEPSPEYERRLVKEGREALLSELRELSRTANITYTTQDAPKGLGDAVLCAKSFVGNEPFAVLYADTVIKSDTPTTKKLCRLYEQYDKLCVGVKEVSESELMRYCSLDAKMLEPDIYICQDIIEKPSPDKIMSRLSILGRVVLPGEIFKVLENQAPGVQGELQLTDAMATIARRDSIIAYKFPGEFFDLGSKLGFLKANVAFGLEHAETGEEFRAFLRDITKNL